MAETLFVLYDERAYSMDTDDAAVLCTARSLKEARSDKRTMFPNAAIFEYDVQGDKLVNERLVECLSQSRRGSRRRDRGHERATSTHSDGD